MEILKNFQNPESVYRSVPFWAWNSKLDADELVRQINEMHKAGIGGFFIHSRDGLETEYMSREWLELTRVAALEAERLGMEAWLYDEDRWPSGTAGGYTTSVYGDAARCKGLTLEVCIDGNAADGDILALYAAVLDGADLSELRRIYQPYTLNTDEVLLVARLEVSGKSEWFNNEAPPDNLNPEAVRYFIAATHERYKTEVGDLFGKSIPGIFTDEPSLHDRHASFHKNRGWIPWTYGFGDYFRKKRGYDPLDVIPFLYFNSDKSPKIRHDYWRTVAERYVEAYSGEISKWCRGNGIAYTGHFLQEDKLGTSTRVNGSIMPHYKLQDVPGVDLLTEQCDEYMTIKQCTSVASQYGKHMVLCEAFGCTGWEFSFEGQKWMGDWQFALGINRLSKHLALYSLKGCRKRDYPPSFNYNTTWWEQAKTVEDYLARISAVITPGKAVRDVLIIHPSTTAWARLGCNPYGNPVRRDERDVPAINKIGDGFNALLKYLSGIHYDYDLGDETLISEDGSAGDSLFKINESAYKVVILPELDTLLSSTVSLLEQFLDSGGKVIVLRRLPEMIDGEASDKAMALAEHKNLIFAENYKQIGRILEDVLTRRVSITDYAGNEVDKALYILKENSDSYALFICNNDRYRGYDININIPLAQNGIIALDPLKGGMFKARADGGTYTTELSPAGSLLLVLPKSHEAISSLPEANDLKLQFLTSFSPGLVVSNPNTGICHCSPMHPGLVVSNPNTGICHCSPMHPECTVRRNMPNALTLDKCSWKIGNSEYSTELEVWQAQYQIRETLGMRQIHLNGLLQRYKWIGEPCTGDGTAVTLRFSFNSLIAAAGCRLLMEEPEHWRIYLNGLDVSNVSNGWFLDRDFKLIELPVLRVGENILEIECSYKNAMEIEDIYILGEFGVDSRRSIIAENAEIRLGDWTVQGYPYYPGSMVYSFSLPCADTENKKVFLRLEEFVAAAAVVYINGHAVCIPWKAAGLVEITEMLSCKDDIIEVEIVSSPRNLLGPFHLAEGKPVNTHDASFRPRGDERIDGYNLHPYGLYSPPKIFYSTK